jgi:hypothetical protein
MRSGDSTPGAAVVGFAPVITYPQGLTAVINREQLTPPQAADLLKETYPNDDSKHFSAVTIRVAARSGQIKNAVKVLDRVWVVTERDLLEWAENETIHRMGRPKSP